MKILHLDNGREMRGGQWQVLRLHNALLEAGHESFLLARENSPLRSAATQCETLSAIQLRAKSKSFDLIHAHDARTHTLAALLSSKPFVVSRRVAFPLRTSAASRWKYKKAERYLAVSNYVARILIQSGIDYSRIDIVYDGVELSPTLTASDRDKLITPYTEDPAKNMALAQQAAKAAKLPLELSKNLTADLPNARAMLYLTESEGLGSAILLAMAYGVPVIATNTGGIPEIIENGVNGILVENNVASVAAALQHLNPELGPKARETVAKRFTIPHMLNATLAAYKQAIQ